MPIKTRWFSAAELHSDLVGVVKFKYNCFLSHSCRCIKSLSHTEIQKNKHWKYFLEDEGLH